MLNLSNRWQSPFSNGVGHGIEHGNLASSQLSHENLTVVPDHYAAWSRMGRRYHPFGHLAGNSIEHSDLVANRLGKKEGRPGGVEVNGSSACGGNNPGGQ